MALGINSDTLMFRMTGEPQPSGRLSASNFSRSLVAAMSTSVFSTYMIWMVEMLSALDDAISALSGRTYTLDMQLQSALEICRLAAAKPQQYTVLADGSRTNS